jgi:hypothetical protein
LPASHARSGGWPGGFCGACCEGTAGRTWQHHWEPCCCCCCCRWWLVVAAAAAAAAAAGVLGLLLVLRLMAEGKLAVAVALAVSAAEPTGWQVGRQQHSES